MRVRLRRLTVLFALGALAFGPGRADALVDAAPDGTAHPYVGYVVEVASGPRMSCTGTLLSSRVVVTAGHCARAQGQPMAVTFAPNRRVAADWYSGTFVRHPRFAAGGSGVPEFVDNDVAVVVLDRDAPGPYAQLPQPGAVDRLPNGTTLGVVGYGVDQLFAATPLPPSGFRMARTAKLVPGAGTLGAEMVKLNGGLCYGDSGGPALLGDVVLAVSSFAPSACNSVSYATRLDAGAAATFVRAFTG